jgi:hypothetical protein
MTKLKNKKSNRIVSSPVETSYIDQLPDDLLDEIFLYLNAQQLCKQLNLVCKKWREVLSSDSFWAQKCIRDRKLNRQLTSMLNEKQIEWSPKHVYFSNMYTRNLIKNPNGDDSFNHWCFCERFEPDSFATAIEFFKQNRQVGREANNWEGEWSDKSNGWSTENTQTGAFEHLKDHNGNLLTCFVTSYMWGVKMQVIDLNEEGIHADMLLKSGLQVEISESYTARNSIKCFYNLKVYLISEGFDIIDLFSHSDYITEFPSKWKTVSHRFQLNSESNQNPVRYVLFYHSGKVCFILKI